MATSFLSRKPDSGLGNIGASPGDPSRNIDWVLMSAQAALTVAPDAPLAERLDAGAPASLAEGVRAVEVCDRARAFAPEGSPR